MTRSSSPLKAAATTTRTTSTTTTESRPFAFALGANLGDAHAALAAAVHSLERRFGPLAVAPIYRTEPVSAIPQPDYLNTVVVGRTDEAPESLLAFGQQLERELGRRRRARDAPREIDIDLLFVGDLVRRGARLALPHPRLRDRRFVLAPLADIASDQPLPPDGVTVGELLARLPPGPRVERLSPARGDDQR